MFARHLGRYCQRSQLHIRSTKPSWASYPTSQIANNRKSSAPSTSPRIPGETLTLPSGRQLGYHTSGPASGTPIVYVHGHPDSGLTIKGSLEKRIADELNVRWIGPDRPGVGLSTAYEEQNVLDYPADICALAEHLKLEKYYIIGTSGGTGFALACARDLPREQLQGVGICAGVGPVECGIESMGEMQQLSMEAWRDHADEMKKYCEQAYVPFAQSDDTTALARHLKQEFETAFTGEDLEVLLEEEAFEASVQVTRQAFVQGGWAMAKGMSTHWRLWGFVLEDIVYPDIKLWYGGSDVSTTPVMGRYMAARLRGSKYREYAGRSHYTMWQDGILQEMIRDLIQSQ